MSLTSLSVLLYIAVAAANLFFAWLACLGLRPFHTRWQVVAWHICLALGAATSALFVNSMVDQWRIAIRLAWLGALVVALIAIGQWMWLGVKARNGK